MVQRISWVVVIATLLAGCGQKEEQSQPAQPAQPTAQTPGQPPNPPPADQRRAIPATNSTSAGEPPRVAPDQRSDAAARGGVANPPAPASASQAASAGALSAQSAPPAIRPRAAPAQEAERAASMAKPQAAPMKPIVLKDGALGAISFQHATHKIDCVTCHHPSREPKPLTSPQQACTACHTKPVSGGMKTARQGAFHDPRAQSGTCIDCHKKAGAKAPVKCADCHKKA